MKNIGKDVKKNKPNFETKKIKNNYLFLPNYSPPKALASNVHPILKELFEICNNAVFVRHAELPQFLVFPFYSFYKKIFTRFTSKFKIYPHFTSFTRFSLHGRV